VGLFVLGIIGLLVTAVSLVSFHGNFANIFNGFVAPYTNSTDSYNGVLQATQKAGYIPGFSIVDTVRSVPLQLSWLAFAYWSSYNAGEFRNATNLKRQYGSMGLVLLFNTLFTALLIYLLESVVGHNFFAAMSYSF
jgi:hypothetical protein